MGREFSGGPVARRIEEEEVAHGLARIGTDFWMGVDRRIGLCFLAIEPLSYLAIR